MAKIAHELQRAVVRRIASGAPGATAGRELARGDGWTVEDVVCTSGPSDRPFEERHTGVSVAIVVAGTFQYRSDTGRAVMTPGSLLLGNPGQCFECGHEHGVGDRCIAFRFDRDWFARLAAAAGARPRFRAPRLPPLRELSPVIAQARAALAGGPAASWEEIGIALAARAAQASQPTTRSGAAPAGAEARVTRVVRAIEARLGEPLTLGALAGEAALSPYHFLRTFRRVTGLTPHQYLLRARLREAAARLASGRSRIIDIAYDCGFGDVSNFNRAFRAEFGMSPRAHRRHA